MVRTLVSPFLLAGLLGATAMTDAASAQTVCGPHDIVAATLSQRHAEHPTAMGLSHGGAMVEIFAAPQGTWSIVMTQPNGVSCLIATGLHWKPVAPPAGGARS